MKMIKLWQISEQMCKNMTMCKIIIRIRRTKIGHLRHIIIGRYNVRRNKPQIEDFKKVYNAKKQMFDKVYDLLEDEESRNTYNAVIKFRMTRNYKDIKKHIYYPQYFVKEIIHNYNNENFVDGGAYIGDSIFGLLKNVPLEKINKIYAWEPDTENCVILANNLKRIFENTSIKAEAIHRALYKEKTTLYLNEVNGQGSKIDDEGIPIETDTIDRRCPDATFIKMDLEGAEVDALYGAKNTIIKNKPKLAISIYHTDEHLYQIPLLIHDWVPEYTLYIRHHSDYTPDTVLYAVLDDAY
jgi:FkbM family methyltransferase